MLKNVLFILFIICLTTTASIMVTGIWIGEQDFGEVWFQTAATSFIVGLAAFLLWFGLTILSTKEKIENLK